MRIKFEKGMTPERIAAEFVRFVRKNGLVIGAVNVYIQTYDEKMKAEKHDKGNYFLCTPPEKYKTEYSEDVARIRRKRMKAI